MNSRAQRNVAGAKTGGGGAAAATNSSVQAQPRATTTTTTTTTSSTSVKPKAASNNGPSKAKQADARLFANALRGTPYALIGGFALQLLGSNKRLCSRYHIFVPTGHTARVHEKLATSSTGFFKKMGSIINTITLDRDGVGSSVRIHEPTALNQAFPDTDDGFVISFSGARILKPALLLNIAIHDWMEHHVADGDDNWKKKKANADIIFLADYIARKEREEMTHATPAFLNAFFAANEGQEPVFFSIGLKKPAVKAVKAGGGATGTGTDGRVLTRGGQAGQKQYA